jgi:hypothetical protein
MAAAVMLSEDKVPRFGLRDVRADLRVVVDSLRALMNDPLTGRAARMFVIDAQRDDQLREMHREFVAGKRARTNEMIRSAIARGQLRADVDPVVAGESLVAPVFYRYLVSGEPVDDAFLDAVVDGFMRAYGPR